MIQGIHHDNLAGYVTNEHIDWTNAPTKDILCNDITMQGHALNLGDVTLATDTVINFYGSTNSGSITYDESLNKFQFGASGINLTGPISNATSTIVTGELTSAGNIIVAGFVDGRDVSADGATLDPLVTGSRFSAHNSSDQAVTTATYTEIICDSEHYDGLGEYATNTGRFTATNAGYYVLFASVMIELLDDGEMFIVQIVKNKAAAGPVLVNARVNSPADDQNIAQSVSVVTYLAATEYVSLVAYHNHGSNLNVTGSTGHYSMISGFRIG